MPTTRIRIASRLGMPRHESFYLESCSSDPSFFSLEFDATLDAIWGPRPIEEDLLLIHFAPHQKNFRPDLPLLRNCNCRKIMTNKSSSSSSSSYNSA